jgi:hypothetical protein
LNRRLQSYLAFKLREIDFELVLHRPIETTRITGHVASSTRLCGYRVCQDLSTRMTDKRRTIPIALVHLKSVAGGRDGDAHPRDRCFEV